MNGPGRTVFFGLVGIMIALAASFVLYQLKEQRMRERARTNQSAPGHAPSAGRRR